MIRCLSALGSVVACAVLVPAAASTPASSESAGLVAFSQAGSIYRSPRTELACANGYGFQPKLRSRLPRSKLVAAGGVDVYLKGGRGTDMELWMSRADGSGGESSTSTQSTSTTPSPGRRTARTSPLRASEFATGTPWIFRATLGGPGEKALTKASREIWHESPAWSPRGDVIAFARYNSFEPARTTIHFVRADGRGSPGRVTAGDEPDWAPDGGSLTFVRGGDVYTINRDRSGLRRLTRTTGKETSPSGGQRERRSLSSVTVPSGLSMLTAAPSGESSAALTRPSTGSSARRRSPRRPSEGTRPRSSTHGSATATSSSRRCRRASRNRVPLEDDRRHCRQPGTRRRLRCHRSWC